METATKEMPSLKDPLACEYDKAFTPPNIIPFKPVGDQHMTASALFGEVITAQRVQVRRDMANVMAQLKALANAMGDKYVYAWRVNDRKNDRKVTVEGPTIKLANDLARVYGNCQVDVRALDHGDHLMFYARFVDLETGFNMTRAFQQRKSQDTGMSDDGRRLDMVFQIGQSKSIRNVIVNALQTLTDFCVDEAKNGLLSRVQKNPDGAREAIKKKLGELNIDVKRVAAVYGRTDQHWTVYDMAKIFTELRSIEDGMALADDTYPTDPKSEPKKRPENKKTTAATPLKPETGAHDSQPTMQDAIAAVKKGDIELAKDISNSLNEQERAHIEQAIANREKAKPKDKNKPAAVFEE